MDAPFRQCEHCGGAGLVTVYHRFYEGSQLVSWEHADARGEVHTIRSAGTVAAHCVCPKGVWMRDNTEDRIRERIPTLADVMANRTNYRATDPTDETLTYSEPSPQAVAFIRRWRAGLPRFFPVEATS